MSASWPFFGKLVGENKLTTSPGEGAEKGLTLGELVDGFLAKIPNAKPNTISNHKQARKRLFDFFGREEPIREVTVGDAKDLENHLSRTLAVNTVRRTCGRAKQFFAYAIDKEWIDKNPFRKLRTRTGGKLATGILCDSGRNAKDN